MNICKRFGRMEFLWEFQEWGCCHTMCVRLALGGHLVAPPPPHTAQVSKGRCASCSKLQCFNSLPSSSAAPWTRGDGCFRAPVTNGMRFLETKIRMFSPAHVIWCFPWNLRTAGVGSTEHWLPFSLPPGMLLINHQFSYPLCHPGVCFLQNTTVSIFCQYFIQGRITIYLNVLVSSGCLHKVP